MELQLYLDILKRRALIIVAVVAAAMTAMIAVSLVIPPIYTANATLRVLIDVGVTDLVTWDDSGKRLLNTYGFVLKSGPILVQTIDSLAPRTDGMTIDDLWDATKVEVIPNTELITIEVQDRDPALARDLANTLAQLLIEYAQDAFVGNTKSTLQIVEEQLSTLEAQLQADRQQLAVLLSNQASDAQLVPLQREIEIEEDSYNRLLERYELARLNDSLRANSISLTEPALLPVQPSNTITLTQIAISFLAGLFGGTGLALAMENLDTRIHSPHQAEHLLDLPVIGSVPRGIQRAIDTATTGDKRHNRSLQEAYRLLRTNLQTMRQDKDIKTVLITSAIPREGKSMVSANLGQVLAEQGNTVFLLESDLRRPAICHMLDIDSERGLSDLLQERKPIDGEALGSVMMPAEVSSLFVIGSGPRVANPTTLLSTPTMEWVMDYLGDQGQITLLDAPPVLGMADVSILAPKVDGVLFVVHESRSKREQVREALQQLQAIRAPILGLIFIQKGSSGWSYDYE